MVKGQCHSSQCKCRTNANNSITYHFVYNEIWRWNCGAYINTFLSAWLIRGMLRRLHTRARAHTHTHTDTCKTLQISLIHQRDISAGCQAYTASSLRFPLFGLLLCLLKLIVFFFILWSSLPEAKIFTVKPNMYLFFTGLHCDDKHVFSWELLNRVETFTLEKLQCLHIVPLLYYASGLNSLLVPNKSTHVHNHAWLKQSFVVSS